MSAVQRGVSGDNSNSSVNNNLPALENNSASYAIAAAIRESTAQLIKANGAPRTTIGVASALGLFAFAVPNFVNAMWQLQLSHTSQSFSNIGVLGVTFFVAFIGQFLAGLWNLTKGDTFGAVAMGAYGLFWGMYSYLIFPTITITSGATSYSINSFGANGMIAFGTANTALTGGYATVAELTAFAGGNSLALLPAEMQAINAANAFIGYCCIPWLLLTFMFCLCALRMALLELWIFIVVECVFICVLGAQFSTYGSGAQLRWTKALGAWSLILAITAMYFIAVILINMTYNAGILPLGHSHPVIESWPHEFGSMKHQETHRNLNLYIPEKKMHRLRSDEQPYNAEDMYHRTHNVAGHPVPDTTVDKKV